MQRHKTKRAKFLKRQAKLQKLNPPKPTPKHKPKPDTLDSL